MGSTGRRTVKASLDGDGVGLVQSSTKCQGDPMNLRSFLRSAGWSAVLILLSTGCDKDPGKADDVSDSPIDSDLPVDDTPVVEPPDESTSVMGQQAGIVSGTAQGFSENYRARIVIGEPAARVQRQSTTYRATVGIGTVQPFEVTP